MPTKLTTWEAMRRSIPSRTSRRWITTRNSCSMPRSTTTSPRESGGNLSKKSQRRLSRSCPCGEARVPTQLPRRSLPRYLSQSSCQKPFTTGGNRSRNVSLPFKRRSSNQQLRRNPNRRLALISRAVQKVPSLAPRSRSTRLLDRSSQPASCPVSSTTSTSTSTSSPLSRKLTISRRRPPI